jgi:hypothetical protein
VSARTKSLIPFRYKLIAGVLAVMMAGFWVQGDDDGGEDEKYKDRNKYRLAAWEIKWTFVGKTVPMLGFTYRVGSNQGHGTERDGDFNVTGFVTNGEVFSIAAGVEEQENSVGHLVCYAFVDGRPVKADMSGDGSRLIHCTAVAIW